MGRGGFDDLAHQATGIDHRLPDRGACAAARIQHQALAARRQVDVQDGRELHVQAARSFHPQQGAELGIVRRRGLQTGQPRIGHQHLVAQAPVFLDQPGAGGGIILHARGQPSGQAGQPPQGLRHYVGLRAHLREPATAMIQDH